MCRGGNNAINIHHPLKSISCKRRMLTLNNGKKQNMNQSESDAKPDIFSNILLGENRICRKISPRAIIKTKKIKLQNSFLFARPEKEQYRQKHFFTY